MRVRLEVQSDCPAHIAEQLLKPFPLKRRKDLYRVDGPINFYLIAEKCGYSELGERRLAVFSVPCLGIRIPLKDPPLK